MAKRRPPKSKIPKRKPKSNKTYREYFSTLSLEQQENQLAIMIRWLFGGRGSIPRRLPPPE